MGIYRDLGRSPGVLRILGSQLAARFPFGMLSIILLLHVEQTFGDYTSAGFVLAALSVGQAVAGPLSSRFMGRWGMRPVLSVTSLVCGFLLLAIAFTQLPLMYVAALALLGGLMTPPVTPAVRTVYPKLVPPLQLSPLFALDAAAQELIWVAGPVVAVFVSSQFGTAAGLCLAAGFMIVGGAWFVMSPAIGAIKLPRPRRGFGAVLRYPTVIITTLIGFFFVASFAALEAGIVAAFAGEDGSSSASMESGIVLAVFATSSLLGGIVLGNREMRPWSLAVRITIVFAGTVAAIPYVEMWWLCIVLFIGGFGTAPVFAAMSNIIAVSVKFSETTEAYGWISTGQLVGVGLGSALAGVAIDAFGAQGGLAISGMLLLACLLVALFAMKQIPDLRGRAIESPPETATNALPLP